jgi:hypothetical protein
MRLLACAFGASVLALSALAAQNYVDPKYGFTVSFPDGWLVVAQSDAGGTVAGVLNEPRTVCVASVTENPTSKGASQAAIDAELRQPFGAEFWREQAAASGPTAKVESHGVRVHPSGRPVQEAVLSEQAAPQGAARRTSMMTVMATPGQVHLILCMTGSESLGLMKPAMVAVADSYRPGRPGALSVSMPDPQPALALRAAANAAATEAKAGALKAWSR